MLRREWKRTLHDLTRLEDEWPRLHEGRIAQLQLRVSLPAGAWPALEIAFLEGFTLGLPGDELAQVESIGIKDGLPEATLYKTI